MKWVKTSRTDSNFHEAVTGAVEAVEPLEPGAAHSRVSCIATLSSSAIQTGPPAAS